MNWELGKERLVTSCLGAHWLTMRTLNFRCYIWTCFKIMWLQNTGEWRNNLMLPSNISPQLTSKLGQTSMAKREPTWEQSGRANRGIPAGIGQQFLLFRPGEELGGDHQVWAGTLSFWEKNKELNMGTHTHQEPHATAVNWSKPSTQALGRKALPCMPSSLHTVLVVKEAPAPSLLPLTRHCRVNSRPRASKSIPRK